MTNIHGGRARWVGRGGAAGGGVVMSVCNLLQDKAIAFFFVFLIEEFYYMEKIHKKEII